MSILRIGGMASGFDTESIVKDLMRVERMKVDRLLQQRQVVEWQKEQYRGMINKVRTFRDSFFDILKPENNLTSPTTLKKMNASSSNNDLVTVTAGAGALLGESTFTVIQSATAATATATAITNTDLDENARLSTSDTMETIGEKLKTGPFVFDENDQIAVTINDVQVTINKTDTLQTVFQKINNSQAGVKITYSSFSDTLNITARNTGEGYITVEDGDSNFFSAFGLTPEGNIIGQAGRDAVFEINGFEGSRSSNTFTIDGLTYSIQKKIDVPTDIINISTSLDVEGIYNTIEKFVSDYNDLIDAINSKTNEEYFRNFQPLTDEQKEAMSDRDIEKWEEKAQSGLLRRDPALDNILSNIRKAIYDAVGEFHLTEIGIETSSNYRDQGKLVLTNGGNDLKAAIGANPDKVANLFSRRSDISYSATLTGEQRAQRYQESGIAARISDILNDNIRTTRDVNGRKGILLERAGIQGDITEFQNYYDNKILNTNKQIDRMNEMLQRREDQYYRQFAAMEKALQQLYSQGDFLMTQMMNNY